MALIKSVKTVKDFNPRSHERSDAGMRFADCRRTNFNPRSHERSDKFAVYQGHCIMISIHAPTRGATGIADDLTKRMEFQSTLPREERRYRLHLIKRSDMNFNPRSHERSDCI